MNLMVVCIYGSRVLLHSAIEISSVGLLFFRCIEAGENDVNAKRSVDATTEGKMSLLLSHAVDWNTCSGFICCLA